MDEFKVYKFEVCVDCHLVTPLLEVDGQEVCEYCHEKDEDSQAEIDDMSDDAEWLASAGHGTDEDYGFFGGDDY